jgi:hypothetical protein
VATDWPPLASAFLDFAERTGAVLATCSNLYGYGPADGLLVESLPLAATGAQGPCPCTDVDRCQGAPCTMPGAFGRRKSAARSSVCPAEQSLIGSARVVPRILAGRKVSVVGSADAEHSWTSPADAARLLVAVAAHQRGWGSAWHVPSNPPRTQRQVVDDLADAAGVERVPVASLSPGMMRIALERSPLPSGNSPRLPISAIGHHRRRRYCGPYGLRDRAETLAGDPRRGHRPLPLGLRMASSPGVPRGQASKSEPMAALTFLRWA